MKRLALVLLTLSFTVMFASCGNKDDLNTSSVESKGVVEDVASDVVEGTEDVASDLKEGVDNFVSDITNDDGTSSATGQVPAANTAGVSVDSSTLTALDNKTNGWGQGRELDNANRPVSCLQFQEKFGQYDARFIGKDSKNIYLTFDEGYENGCTAQILDVLKKKKCPAVFFVTMDYVTKNPDLVKRMIKEGHVVGNHTVSHPSMPSVSIEQGVQEIMDLHQYVLEHFNYTMTLFRPPKGEYSERTLAMTQQLNYKTVFWSYAYRDWETDRQPDPSQALKQTTSAVHNGAIYLLHAVSTTNTNILGDFITTLQNDGYKFKKLS